MTIDISTIFPEMFDSYLNESLLKRAQKKKLLKIRAHDLRKWTSDRHKTVDDKPFGGRASSAQFQLPAGWSYVLYSNSDYNGAKRLVLTGTGRLRSALNFKKHDFGDRARSARLVRTDKAIKMRGAIVV